MTVWRFWQQVNANSLNYLLQACDYTCRLHLHNYNTPVLNLDSAELSSIRIHPRILQDPTLLIAQKSDYIRLSLLNAFGGVWFDYDTIFFPSVAHQLDAANNLHDLFSFGAFSMAAFGGPAGHPFFQRCLDRMDDVLDSREHIDYTALGGDIMYKEILNFEYKQLSGALWLLPFEQWERFFEPHPPLDEARFQDASIAFLYNKMMQAHCAQLPPSYYSENRSLLISRLLSLAGAF
jgi:hypothetical protein